MKLAVIGDDQIAKNCAAYFTELGAEVFLFTQETEVLRVHKRFLHTSEEIINRTRLHDLFRVVYAVNPKENILKQVEENPEMFNKLGDEVLKSLHHAIESFRDFDLVIDTRRDKWESIPMGAGASFALNEKNLKQNSPIFYQEDALLDSNLSKHQHIIVLGESPILSLLLDQLEDWLWGTKQNKLSWINYRETENKQLKKLIEKSERQFDQDKLDYEIKLREWRDLEDYIRAKIPEPTLPSKKIDLYLGYDATSVDKLLDQDKMFLTIEKPHFRDRHLEEDDLKTLACDAIYVLKGYRLKNYADSALRENEPGYFYLNIASMDLLERKLKIIEEEILKYFSRAE